ncbi:MAG: RagB/SusD family nutrient uptake outer membrane protein [Cyclobacteriaceae bacterium]
MKNMKLLYKSITPYIFLGLGLLASCEGVFDLNEAPRDRVSGEQVFQDENFAQALLADLYARFPFDGFANHTTALGNHDLGTMRGNSATSCRTHGGMTGTNDCWGLWEYSYIRDLNFFIESIRESPLSQTFREKLEGEVRTLRAAVYFKMQQRYGGVPLVDVVLDPFGDVPIEYQRRSTEEEIADFIDSELQASADLLAGLGSTSAKGRINEWTAYAYKARANLWSASIANFGTLASNNLTGIPAGRANEFYGKASTAAQTVINSGEYSLLQGGDMERTYWNTVIEDSNDEVIFEKIYNGVEINHAFSHLVQPTPYSEGQGSQLNPTLGLVNSYENLDGTFSTPAFGPNNLYPTGTAPWANKDPRLFATVFFEGDTYVGNRIDLWEGVDPTQGGTDPDAIVSEIGVYVQNGTTNTDGNGKHSIGVASRLQENHFRPSTGFMLEKYVAETPFVPDDTEAYNWKELRLAEMYLIAAEAEFEMGNTGPATTFLNFTRNRVGLMDIEATPGGITRDRIRTERTSELIYEGHRWNDIRRWRTAESLLNGQIVEGLRVIFHEETGQLYFLVIPAETVQRQFRPEHYYNPITDGRIEDNGELIENPGY